MNSTKRRVVALTGAVSMGAALVLPIAGPAQAAATKRLNVERACDIQYSGKAPNPYFYAEPLSKTDAYSWSCFVVGFGFSVVVNLGGIDMAAACKEQYGAAWKPAVKNETDPYSWYCFK